MLSFYFFLLGAVVAQLDPSSLNAIDSNVSCLVEENSNYAQDLTVVLGEENIKETLQECCDQCISNPMCNVLVYCDNKDGCGPQKQYQYQICALKFQAAVANGGVPLAYDRGSDETFTSGYLIDKVLSKGVDEALCPSLADGLTVVFGENYPPLANHIFENKQIRPFITAQSNVQQVYMHSISEKEFCILEDGQIAGDLLIYADDSFPESLEALSEITVIGGDLIIMASNHTSLQSIQGLHNLSEIKGSLYMDGVDSLAGGLTSLRNVGENVVLKNIGDFMGFSIPQIAGDLRLSGEDIVNLEGLEGISKVSGNVGIVETSLVDLVGLKGLVEVGGAFLVNNNQQLRSLDGLDTLYETDSLILAKNPALKFLDPLVETLEVAKSVHIYENGGISRNDSQTLFGIVEGAPAPIDDLKAALVTISEDM